MTIEEAYKYEARMRAEEQAAQRRKRYERQRVAYYAKCALDGAAIIATAVTVGIMLFLG